jgi:antitoxin (DNA-binding transcriptional repressor) of toxin-antitoxin stability system
MAITIAQEDLAQSVDHVLTGSRYIVVNDGVSVAELCPVGAPQNPFVPKAQLMHCSGRGPSGDLTALRADIDAVIDGTLSAD